MSLTTLSCFVGLALLGIACGRGGAVSPPVPGLRAPTAPGNVALAVAAPSVAVAPSAAPAAVLVAQPPPPPGKEELARWFDNVCQLAVVPRMAPEPPSFGCGCCAPFEGCQPGSAGEPVEMVFAPSATVRGSFTRVGADELAVTMPGCESHADNYGGLLLLERRSEGFAMERYVSGLNASACWAVRRDDGRDLLLCQRGDVHQGTADERLFLWDLAETDEPLLATEQLISVRDNELSGCWSPVGTEVSSLKLLPPELRPQAGRVELVLQLDARRGRVTSAYLARCNALEQDEDAAAARALPIPRTLLRHSRERLVFRFDGAKFERRK